MTQLVDIEAEKKDILRRKKLYEDLENERDLEGILELMTEDSVFMSHRFKHEGKENIREWFKGNLRTVVSSKHCPYVSRFLRQVIWLGCWGMRQVNV